MFSIRKFIYIPIIVVLAVFGLAAYHSPVHAEDSVPPISDTPAEAQPESPAAEPAAEPPVGESAPVEVSAPTDTEQEEPVLENPVEPPAVVEEPAADNPVQPPVEESVPPEASPEAPVEVTETAPTETPADESEQPVISEPEQPTPSTGLATELQIELGEETDSASVPQVVVVDESGNSIPLVTADAAEALINPDPYFYVGATKYSFMTDCTGVVNCTTAANPLQAAFTAIATNNYSVVGGAVYVEANTVGTPYGSLVINSSMWGSNPIPASLSLIGAGVVDKSIGSSVDHFINGTISVTGMKSFTIQAFTITGNVGTPNALVTFDLNTGTINLIDVDIKNSGTGSGLTVKHHTGAINLNMVDSSDNSEWGAYIDVGASAPLTIKNSSFNRNGIEGLYIKSNSAVNLTGVTANLNLGYAGAAIVSKGLTVNQSIFSNNNGGYGLWVDANNLGGATLIQNSQFNNNANMGLSINQNGNVDIKNIRANDNGSNGLWVDTCRGEPCINPFTGNVSVIQSEFGSNVKTATGGDPTC